jgi:hypothetical protein
MRFDTLPDDQSSDLAQLLREHLGNLERVNPTEFFLRESCRYWEATVRGSRIVGISGDDLWHHLIRGGKELMISVRSRTQSGGELRFQLLLQEPQGDESRGAGLPNQFDRAVDSLDRGIDLPEELESDDVIARLLEIRASFFYGLSFHLGRDLLYVMPLTYPSYFDRLFADRRFWRPEELAAVLSAAPSFFGIGPAEDST